MTFISQITNRDQYSRVSDFDFSAMRFVKQCLASLNSTLPLWPKPTCQSKGLMQENMKAFLLLFQLSLLSYFLRQTELPFPDKSRLDRTLSAFTFILESSTTAGAAYHCVGGGGGGMEFSTSICGRVQQIHMADGSAGDYVRPLRTTSMPFSPWIWALNDTKSYCLSFTKIR